MSAEPLLAPTLGAYRILHELPGSASQREWLAEEQGPGFTRRVVLKVATPGAEERTREEATVLAGLEHPGIARLYAAGTTADATPYLVLEPVDGQPLMAFAERRQLAPRARLELFFPVLAAVGYAHHHLVTHRQLTANSVWVTAGGEVKVLGFGTAPPDSPGTGSLGLTGDLQALGELLTALLLAQPLTRLPADLAATLTRARGRDPAASYPSIEAFAEDLRRFRDGYPVAARRGGRWNVTKKFLGRHRWAAVATTGVTLALAGSLAGALHQTREAEQAQQLAERRFADVQGLAHALIFDISGAVWELPNSEQAASLILARALTYLQRLEEDAGDDPTLLADLAGGYGRLGDIAGTSRGFGKGTRSPEQAFAAWERGITLRQRLYARETTSPTPGLFLANDLQMYADSLRMNGQANAPRRIEVQTLERQTLSDLLARFPDHPRVRWAWAQHLATEAFLDLHSRPPEERKPRLNTAWAAWQPFFASPIDELRELPQFGPAGSNLALSLYEGDRYEEAAQTVRLAIRVLERVGGPYESHLSTAYGVLAVSLHELGRHDEALQVAQKKLAMERALFTTSGDPTLSQINYFQALLHGCLLAATAGDETATLSILREGGQLLSRLEETWSAEVLLSSRIEWLRTSGHAYSELARTAGHGSRGRYRQQARGAYQRGLALIASKTGNDHMELAAIAEELRASLAELD